MSTSRILPTFHVDEFPVSLALIKKLVASQFPQYATLPLSVVRPGGTDHFMVRLGQDYLVRLPRHAGAMNAVEVERTWLPLIAPHLTIDTPAPLHYGNPTQEYPWHWAVLPWLKGRPTKQFELRTAHGGEMAEQLARDMGTFVKSLRDIPVPSDIEDEKLPKSYRTQSLSDRTSTLASALSECRDIFDTARIMDVWTAHLVSINNSSSANRSGPAIAHGDLQPANILLTEDATRSRLTAVLDWGGLSVGDPAIDLLPAWMLFDAEPRRVFRVASGADNEMWLRGRAWALSVGIIAFPYYRESRPEHAEVSRRQVEEVLTDYEQSSESL